MNASYDDCEALIKRYEPEETQVPEYMSVKGAKKTKVFAFFIASFFVPSSTARRLSKDVAFVRPRHLQQNPSRRVPRYDVSPNVVLRCIIAQHVILFASLRN